jgi:hypothetical protein
LAADCAFPGGNARPEGWPGRRNCPPSTGRDQAAVKEITMRAPLRFVASFLLLPLLPCVTACGHGFPSAPKGADTLMVKASMSNAQGATTIIEAAMNVDNFTVADSCPPQDEEQDFDNDGNPDGETCDAPPSSAVTLAGSASINPGTHHITFGVPTTNTTHPVPYTISGFSLSVYDGNGKLVKSMSFPDQTTVLNLGAAVSYSFSF